MQDFGLSMSDNINRNYGISDDIFIFFMRCGCLSAATNGVARFCNHESWSFCIFQRLEKSFKNTQKMFGLSDFQNQNFPRGKEPLKFEIAARSAQPGNSTQVDFLFVSLCVFLRIFSTTILMGVCFLVKGFICTAWFKKNVIDENLFLNVLWTKSSALLNFDTPMEDV